MTFDGTISVGNLLTALAILGGYIAVAYKTSVNVAQHDFRINALEKAHEAVASGLKQLSSVLEMLARQDERLMMMRRDIEELKHGRGFVIQDFNEYGHLAPGTPPKPSK